MSINQRSPERTNGNTNDSQNKMSYGFQIPTREQVKEIKTKIETLKAAILEERSQRQLSQKQLKELNIKYLSAEQLLQKKQQKNENLLHQSRQLKDILIRQKQQIKKIEAEIQILNEKRRKVGPRSSRNGPTVPPKKEAHEPGWKGYLTSLWK